MGFESIAAGTYANADSDNAGGIREERPEVELHSTSGGWLQNVKRYSSITTLANIEKRVPPNILLQFISAYLVQAPTVRQVMLAYKSTDWGDENESLSSVKLFCSLSVALASLPAKKAAVKWAETELVRVSANPDSSEHRRLVQSWHKALSVEGVIDFASKRREMKKEQEKHSENHKGSNEAMLDLKFARGRKEEEIRLENLRTYTRKYPGIGFDNGRKTSVPNVLKIGDLKSGKTKSFKARIKTSVAFGLFKAQAIDKRTNRVLNKMRKFQNAKRKIKQSMRSIKGFRFSEPKSPSTASQPQTNVLESSNKVNI